MMRLALAAMMLPAAAAAPTCTAATCCSDIVYGKCTGNTHAAPVAPADALLSAGADDWTCTAGYMTGAGTDCPTAACDDATCCTAHAVTTGCAAGEYLVEGTATANEACTACAAGKWQAASANRAAAVAAGVCEDHTDCAAGKATTTAGTAAADATCTDCETGKFNTDGSGACTTLTATCPSGKGWTTQVTALTTDHTCADCAGTFNALDDDLACATGTNTAGCAAGEHLVQAAGATDDACTACADGSWQAASANRDAAVAAGVCELQSVTACGIAGEGNNVATALTHPNVVAKTAAVVCTACETGKFATDADVSCETLAVVGECVAGTRFTAQVTALQTNNRCVPCTTGTWDADADPATDCVAVATTANCPAGFELSAGSTILNQGCIACTAGKIQASATGTACADHAAITCTTGQQAAQTPSAQTCEACPAGKWSGATDGAACASYTPCVLDEYVSVVGTAIVDVTCTACTAGKTLAAATSTDGALTTCTAITGSCDNGLDADDFACGTGTYVAGNYRAAADAVTAVLAVTPDCYVTGSTTDNTVCTIVTAAGNYRAAADAVIATATVYGVPAVTAMAAADPVCSAGCTYVAQVSPVNAAAAAPASVGTITSGHWSQSQCPEPVAAAKVSGAAAAAPLAAVAALLAAMA